jgi:hypothetical protein
LAASHRVKNNVRLSVGRVADAWTANSIQEIFVKGVITMNRLLVAVVALAIGLAAAESARAQVYRAYYPAPAPVAVTSYYAPGPVAYAPAPTTVYYPAAPAVVATTRYRPLIGGSITRWRYVNRPAYVYPTTVAYYPAW